MRVVLAEAFFVMSTVSKLLSYFISRWHFSMEIIIQAGLLLSINRKYVCKSSWKPVSILFSACIQIVVKTNISVATVEMHNSRIVLYWFEM